MLRNIVIQLYKADCVDCLEYGQSIKLGGVDIMEIVYILVSDRETT